MSSGCFLQRLQRDAIVYPSMSLGGAGFRARNLLACGSSVEESDMDPRDEIAPVQVSPQESARLAARRRLLRGSLGVPAVLTLSSGAALAAASSPIRCFNNAPADASDSATSNFALQQYKGTEASGNATVYVVRAEDVTALVSASVGMFQLPTSPLFTAGTWIQISTFTVIDVKSGMGNEPQPDGTNSVAPRFDRTGGTEAAPVFTVTGLVPLGSSAIATTTNSGRIISKSCWTSFK
jgi:hypothetical protein